MSAFDCIKKILPKEKEYDSSKGVWRSSKNVDWKLVGGCLATLAVAGAGFAISPGLTAFVFGASAFYTASQRLGNFLTDELGRRLSKPTGLLHPPRGPSCTR